MLFETTQSHELNLAKSSVSGILSLAIVPILLALFLPFIYVLSDIVFIEKIRPELFSTFLEVAPFAFLPSLLILFFATGTSGLVTKYIAQFEYDQAESIAGSGVIWSFLIGAGISGFGAYAIYNFDLSTLNINKELTSYLLPILVGLPFLILSLTYLDLLRAQGKTMLSAIIVTLSIALNIALNQIANEYSGFQVIGIAGASSVSLVITTFVLMALLSSGRTEIRVKAEHFKPNIIDLFSILTKSSLFFSIIASMAVSIIGLYFWISQNQPVSFTNDIFKQSFLISCTVIFVLFSPCIALLLAYQTLSTFNLATFIYQRVKAAHKFTIRTISIYGVLLSATLLAFPAEFLEVLAIDSQLHNEVINLCLVLTIASTLFLINASWGTFLQTQNSIFGAILIVWMPTAIIAGIYFTTPIIEQTLNIVLTTELIWYAFIAAQLLTCIFGWLRFTFAFHEINKVKIEKDEKVKPIKVTTSAKKEEKVDKIIVSKSTEKTSVNEDFDNDFISSFASNDDDQLEQLDEIDDVDEFEKAMQSYNQKMESGNAVSEKALIDEPTNKYAGFETQAEPESPQEEVSEQIEPAKPINTEEVLNEIPVTEDNFAEDIFSNEDIENAQIKPTTNEEPAIPVAETLELDDAFADFEAQLPDSAQVTEKSNEPEIQLNDLESDLSLDDEFAIPEELELDSTTQDLNDSLESMEFDSAEELNAEFEVDLSSEIDTSSLNSIESDLNSLEQLDESTDALADIQFDEPIQQSTNKKESTANEFDPELDQFEYSINNELSTDLEKISQEFNELYENNSETDLTNLDELISQVDTGEDESDSTSNITPETPSNNNKELFVASGDEEIMEIFFEEAEEIFEVLPQRIQSFRNKSNDKSIAKELQRDFHTLKGGSRMAALEPIGDICHQYEMLFERICNGSKKANDNLFNILDDGFNEVQQAIKNIEANNQHMFDPALIEKIKAV